MIEENKKQKVLIIDDEEMNLKLLSAILTNNGYEYDMAKNGREALQKVKEFIPDLVLLDIMMPEMDGYEVCRRLKSDASTQNIPIIMITALADRESRIKGLDSGASDFLTKPFDRVELVLRTKNLLKIKEFEGFLLNHNRILEEKVLERTEELKKAFQQIDKTYKEVKEGYIDTIERLTIVAEYKDEETAGHIRRVGHYCSVIAACLGLQGKAIEEISYAAPMHDIGKVGVPSEILLKRGKLTSEEFSLMKTHTTMGGNILRNSSSELLQMAQRIALTHHERWDGSGYPGGLTGEEIPIEGRIMNIVDQYDAIRSPRPYKEGLSHEKAVEIITKGDGRTMPEHFDPEVLKAFLTVSGELDKIFETHGD